MLCREVHEDEFEPCETELEPSYWFCPKCGRPTGHVALRPDAEVIMTAGEPHSPKITIPCRGYQRIPVSIKFEPLVEGVTLMADPGTLFHADPRQALHIQIQIPPQQASRMIGRLIVTAKDGKPTAHGPAARTISADVRAEVRPKGGLDIEQTVLYFRDGQTERSLTLQNTALCPVDFRLDDIPLGYRVTPTQGTVKAVEGGQPGRATIRVQRDLSVLQVDPLSALSVVASDGGRRTVSLRWIKGTQTQTRPRAVVGIDLGTSYTSVALRDCRNHPDMPDDIFILSPRGQQASRFRTYIWLGKSGVFHHGADAYRQYSERPGDGYLFLEAKHLLRAPDEVRVYPPHLKDEAVAHAEKLHGTAWGEALIGSYLKWLRHHIVERELRERYGIETAPVQFVFSIPVLDYSLGDETLFQRQRAAMERCVRQAQYPEDFETLFPFEPTCAAAALLNPPQGAPDWPRLGGAEWPLDHENRIAVFDSGGGTTDLILGRLSVGDGGTVELSVDRCLGVGGAHETFGGEFISGTMKEWLIDNQSRYVECLRGLHMGAVDPQRIVPGLESLGELQRLMAMEDLKLRLAEVSDDWLEVDTQRPPLKLHRDLLTRICEEPLASLRQSVEEHLLRGLNPSDIRYYLDVGGNTRVPAVAQWLATTMADHDGPSSKRHLRLPDDQRQLAVARGAAWIPDAGVRDPIPMDIQVVVMRRDGSLIADRKWEQGLPISGPGQVRQIEVEVSARDCVSIEVRTGPSGADGRIGIAEWHNSDIRSARLTLECRMDGARLAVTAHSSQTPDQNAVLLECPL